MSSESFRFRQFEVFHDQCGMKVGMDGVTLGAWATMPETDAEVTRILDIGTGSGLIALMLAQRYDKAMIDAVEKDIDASFQAADNFSNSPWSDRLQIYQGCFPEMTEYFSHPVREAYQLIVCNPPFFKDDLKPIDHSRSLARHCEDLTFANLVQGVAPLLHPQGLFSVIVPFEAAEIFSEYCWEYKLFPYCQCDLYPVEGKKPKRALLTFSKIHGEMQRTKLSVADSKGRYTDAYWQLTEEYYLVRQ